MPATEQTWRDLKWMHVLFGVSSLAMLATTVWMLYADYTRGWKPFQRASQSIDTWYTKARITEADTADFELRRRELVADLDADLAAAPDQQYLDAFIAELAGYASEGEIAALRDSYQQLRENPTAAGHTALMDELQTYIRSARFDEDNLAQKRKFARADLDVARSDYELGVGSNLPAEKLAAMQENVTDIQGTVDELTASYQDATTHRKELEKILGQMTAPETAGSKALADHDATIEQMRKAYAAQTATGRNLLTLPILDAFNSPLEIKQNWLPLLTINYNFRTVARFDRCTTCHLGIDKTAPGSAIEGGYDHERRLTFQMGTPEKRPEPSQDDKGQTVEPTVSQVYGLELAQEGLLRADDVTIEVVWPRKSAARAAEANGAAPDGLKAGDVIEQISDVIIRDREQALRYLVGDGVKWGQPLRLKVRRGMPHPYSSHPRLDLYVGSLSPHKLETFGCTICHDGQGSATDFKWASHTPNTIGQMEEWKRDHGWFHNHHWIFPMLPERFLESNCLKCHHEVTELEPSERFPEPPAPKLLSGYNTIRQYGCYGCHEINGFNGRQRIGPDLRTEPNYTAAALQLLTDPGLQPSATRALDDQVEQQAELVKELDDQIADTDDEALLKQKREARAEAQATLDQLRQGQDRVEQAITLAPQVVAEPENAAVRRRLWEVIMADADLPANGPAGDVPRMSAMAHSLAAVLQDVENPGKLRKPGPSLRYVGHKLQAGFLYDWIGNPTNFRPTTRMPRFFGLAGQPKLDKSGQPVQPVQLDDVGLGLEKAEKYEPIEIRAAAAYLLAATQPFEYLDVPEAWSDAPEDQRLAPSAERGKDVFQIRGCLACHQHKDFPTSEFPEAKATQGPDLSRMGMKLSRENTGRTVHGWQQAGAQWLYSWVRKPNRYHARTVMPDLFLETITDKEGKVSDPAADVTAFLLGSQDEEYQPVKAPEIDEAALHDLALEHLGAKFTTRQSEEFLASGIPADGGFDVKGDELELLQTDGPFTDDNRVDRQLRYVGRRTISKYGCSGCHDIPGYEDAKPIGTALAGWARKDLSQLAFEQIVAYVTQHGAGQPADGAPAAHGNGHGGEPQLDVRDMPDDVGLFVHALLNHQREGFLWQKLRAPRTYDYKKTENKIYNDRLKMPRFGFSLTQVEAVMTFVLGLTNETPSKDYIYVPDARRQAIVAGRQVVDKYNCAGCHELATEKWEFEYDPNWVFSEDTDAGTQERPFLDPHRFPANEFSMFRAHFTPEDLAASRKLDRRGMGRSTVTAWKFWDEHGEPQEGEDAAGAVTQSLLLWKPAAINGQAWLSNEQVPVPAAWIKRHYPAEGGGLAHLLQPVLFRREGQGKWENSWGWVPPPLVHEGRKVLPDWLHSFLLDPYRIRPDVPLRMPKFNMSSDEASKLVAYFAAADGAEYPYKFDARTREAYVEASEALHPGRLDDAFRILTNAKTYCAKCHRIGDYAPSDPQKGKGPNLALVYRRLRPEFIRPWLANPARTLPYTAMPQNFKVSEPLDLKSFEQGEVGDLILHGTGEEQLDAVMDLLLNYDWYMKRKTPISPLVKIPPPEPAAEGSGAEGEGAAGAGNEGASNVEGAGARAEPPDAPERAADAGS